ncbi:uncharacterized protein LOC141587916 [Silene latifolia]|uniref:uncharacterized protein LOC141587916 n=1 Tax=Silene latifolia TaxID=37657 RepID=UPI003D785E01
MPKDTLYSPLDDPLFLSLTDQPNLILSSFLFDGSNFIQWQREIIYALLSKNKSLWSNILERYGQLNVLDLYAIKKDLSNTSQDTSSLLDYYGKIKNLWENIDTMDPIPQCTCGAMKNCTCQLLKRLLGRETQTKLIQLLMGLNSEFEQLQTHILTLDPLPPINKALGTLQKIEHQKLIYDITSDIDVESVAYAAKKRTQSYSSKDEVSKKRLKDDASTGPEDGKYCELCGRSGHTINECWRHKTCTFCNTKGHIKERCYKFKAYNAKKGNSNMETGSSKAANNAEPVYSEQDCHYQDVAPFSVAQPLMHEYAAGSSVGYSGHNQVSTNAHVSPDFVQGIVNSVMAKVSQEMNEKNKPSNSTLQYSVNFAGMYLSSHACAVNNSSSKMDWIVDTGASDHMTSNMSLLHDIICLSRLVYVGLPDGSVKIVHKTRTARITDKIVLHNVLFIPDFKQNLLSVGKLIASTGLLVLFLDVNCVFQDPTSKDIVVLARRTGDLYKLRSNNACSSVVTCSFVNKEISVNSNKTLSQSQDVSLLHARLGHSSLDKMRHVNSEQLKGIKKFTCDTCVLAKHHILPFPKSTSYANECFKLVHMDVWGLYKIRTLTGARSFLTILDDHSRLICRYPVAHVHMTWTFFMHNKTQVPGLVKGFVSYVETQFDKTIKVIRSDNGTELFQTYCKDYFTVKGIVHQRSIVGRPQQNGRVEKKHRHLLDTARALQLQSKVPIKFWEMSYSRKGVYLFQVPVQTKAPHASPADCVISADFLQSINTEVPSSSSEVLENPGGPTATAQVLTDIGTEAEPTITTPTVTVQTSDDDVATGPVADQPSQLVRKSARLRIPSVLLSDYHCPQ